MTKFFEEFTKRTNGKFDALKLNSATYFKDKRELTVRFIISAFEIRNLREDEKAEIQKIIEDIFAGVKISVQYVRTYADQNVVKNKIIEYFNTRNQLVFRRIKDDSIDVSVFDKEIDIRLLFETPTYKMLDAGDTASALKDYLDMWFNQSVDVILEEKVVDLKELADEEIHIDTTVVRDTSLRLVQVNVGEKIYARGKVGGISQLPNYISDIKGATDNIILCGKVSNISKHMYKNKKYNPDDAKSRDAELPLIRFMLDDTTSKIECVCFPRAEEAEAIEKMAERSHIVCAGKVGISAYNNALSFTINSIFGCEIDFESIHLKTLKGVPERYETVMPEPFKLVAQNSLFDLEENDVSAFLKDKTFIIYDLEATDRFPETAEIIELAALKVVNGQAVETFKTLVKPVEPIPAKITEITSIDNAMVADAPPIEQVLPDFYKFSRGGALVGHNVVGYDYPLLAKFAEKEGYNFDNDLVDTLLLARKHLTELHSFALENISKNFGISHENAHRAMSDVLATFELLKILAKRM